MATNNLIARDSRVRKLLRLLAKGRFKFDCNAAIREIRTLHREREGRQLKVSDVLHKFQSTFLHSVLQAQANRSRIVEIKMTAFSIHAKLDKHVSLVRKHLRHTYMVPLNRMGGTAVDRDSLLDSILQPAISHLKDLKTVADIADLAISDLDQAGWNFKLVVQVMEQISERKTAKV